MTPTAPRKSLFKDAGAPARSKSDAGDKSAKAIVEAEARKRDDKTARLRKARMEMEAAMPAAEPAAKPQRAKPARKS